MKNSGGFSMNGSPASVGTTQSPFLTMSYTRPNVYASSGFQGSCPTSPSASQVSTKAIRPSCLSSDGGAEGIIGAPRGACDCYSTWEPGTKKAAEAAFCGGRHAANS